jgi:hypothetical protein
MSVFQRSFLAVIAAAMFLLPGAVFCGENAGKMVDDSIYVDNKFGFSLTVPNTWKVQEIYGNDDIERVVLMMKNPTMPVEFQKHEDYFTQPQVTILAYNIKANPKEYAEFLLAEDGKDKLKDAAHDDFILFQIESKYSFEPRRTSSVKIGGQHGARIRGRKQYYWAFEGEGASGDDRTGYARGDILADYISGSIYVVSTDDALLLIECVSEQEMARELDDEFDRILDGIKFESEDD